MASLATSQTEKASIEAFKADVIAASMSALVLVDFWAEWCGPCKTLTPLLERVVASYAPRVKLVKIDVDKNQTLAAQFRIESIPTVFAFVGGKPVDGFAGAVGERELKALIDRLLATMPPAAGPGDAAAQIAELAAAAHGAFAEAAFGPAAEMFAALAAQVPDRSEFAAGLARALLASGDVAGAEAALAGVPLTDKLPALAQARAGIALAREVAPVEDMAALAAQVAASPDDMALRFSLASGYMARGDRDGAAAELLECIRRDASWNDGAARARLLKLFEAMGLVDPWVVATRRKLSTLLFS